MRWWNPWWMVIALAAYGAVAYTAGSAPAAWLFGGLAVAALLGWRRRAASRGSPWQDRDLLARRRSRPEVPGRRQSASAGNGHRP
jgi:MYXO-CTERM domain-containing protein